MQAPFQGAGVVESTVMSQHLLFTLCFKMSVAEVLRARTREGEGAEGGAGEADRRADQAQADHGEYLSTCLTLSFLSLPVNHL